MLTNPADTGGVYLANLQELVTTYPQSGLLRAMYGRALNEATPVIAGGYFDSRALHKLIYHPDSLLPVDAGQIIIENTSALNQYAAAAVITAEAPDEPAVIYQESGNETSGSQPEDLLVTTIADSQGLNEEETALQDGSREVLSLPAAFTEPGAEMPAATLVDDETSGRAPWDTDEDDEDTAPQAVDLPVEENMEPIPDETEPERIEPEPENLEQETEGTVTAAAQTEQPVQTAAVNKTEPVAAGLTPWDLIAEEYAAQAARLNGQATHAVPETDAGSDINEETYDEITGIDDLFINHQPGHNTVEGPAPADEIEAPATGNIAGTDYFSFDHTFNEYDNGAPAVPGENDPAPYEAQPGHDENAARHNDVSKYHDEKMPYTFMWWLDKTRKEHDATYQPYVKGPGNANGNIAGKRTKTDELQQQYFENIFHLAPLENLTNINDPQTVEFDMHNKEDRLIKRFITEEPHIHPPIGERLDTENKAKRSSEDDYDMVTETLARIYADQMLFPKAIATYKKLMLKYPEKSRYFASRIDALEKRTN